MFFFIFCAIILAFSLRGLPGNPTTKQLLTPIWKDQGPFELSPERGRFTLLYSIMENKSFSFSPQLARFTAPDVAYSHGKYVSLFDPGLSFMVMPGYLIGKFFGASQVGTFAIVSVFALLNVALIRLIAIRLGAHPLAATIGGFGFLFASPAFAYAVNLYQHHISTFLILSSIYLFIRFKSDWSLAVIWMLCGLSVVIDYPNFFMMLPIGVATLSRLFFLQKNDDGNIALTIYLKKFITFSSFILPILFFCIVNTLSYGYPFQLAGALERPIAIKANGQPILHKDILKKQRTLSPSAQPSIFQKNVLNFFINRNMLNGFYIHFVSPDRGILEYTPIMFFSILGMYVSWKKSIPFLSLLLSITGINILLYSLWSDPWGGWAFGSRYLIPSYAILSIFIALALTQFQKKTFVLLLFLLVLTYSIFINTVGAITTSTNPPQVEIAALEKVSGMKQEYTFVKNFYFLTSGQSKSFLFKAVASHYMSALNYYIYLTTILVTCAGILVGSLRFLVRREYRYEN